MKLTLCDCVVHGAMELPLPFCSDIILQMQITCAGLAMQSFRLHNCLCIPSLVVVCKVLEIK